MSASGLINALEKQASVKGGLLPFIKKYVKPILSFVFL
jgi:hypothetical protein